MILCIYDPRGDLYCAGIGWLSVHTEGRVQKGPTLRLHQQQQRRGGGNYADISHGLTQVCLALLLQHKAVGNGWDLVLLLCLWSHSPVLWSLCSQGN